MNILIPILFKIAFYYLSIGVVFHAFYHFIEFGDHYYAVVFEGALMHNLGTCSLPLTSLLSNWLFMILSLMLITLIIELEEKEKNKNYE